MMRTSTIKLGQRLAVGITIFCLAGGTVIPQSSDAESSRRFWPPNFRPASTTAKVKPKLVKYRRTTPALPQEASAVLGVTIWRLRPATKTDEARILITKSGKKADWTPERVEASTAFSEGQMVRLSIEVPRTGYLYVVNREQYANNTLSEPYLIFPLAATSAANKVTAGRVVELPSQQDEQAVFELHSLREAGKPAQVAELLTFIISPEPLTGLPPATAADAPIKLPAALVEDWEKRWGAQVEQLEMEHGAGKAYTQAEQRAGLNVNQRLTQADPLPQTIFRVNAKRGSPFVVKMPLKIAQ